MRDRRPQLLTAIASSPGNPFPSGFPDEKPRTQTGFQRSLAADLRSVASLLDRLDQVVSFDFSFFDLDGGLANFDIGAFDPFDARKCGPHFSDATDGSGHSGDGQIDGLLRGGGIGRCGQALLDGGGNGRAGRDRGHQYRTAED